MEWSYKIASKPPVPHVTGYDFNGLPAYNAWLPRTAEAMWNSCPHQDSWGYIESAKSDVPPCILYGARVRRDGCPSKDEAGCFFRSVKFMCGRSKKAEEIAEAIPETPRKESLFDF